MVVQQVAPVVVAQRRGALRRSDDVGENYCGEHSFGVEATTHAGDEFFDLVKHRGGVADPIQHIFAGQLHIP